MRSILFWCATLALVYLASGGPVHGKNVVRQAPPANPPSLPADYGQPMDVASGNTGDKPSSENKEEGKVKEETEELKGDEDNEADNENTKEKSEEDADVPDAPQTEKEKDREQEAEENPKMFEGDLKLPQSEIDKLVSYSSSKKKDAVTNVANKWPNNRVPYLFSGSVDPVTKQVIKRAIVQFHKKTCIRLVKKTKNDKDYILMTKKKGCYSTSLGKSSAGGEQIISIGRGCAWVGTVIHEIMHAIGFFHEHTRLDRDDYVTVNWDNIEKDMESQFKKYAHGEADYLGEPYDYDSVMHYPRTGFGIKVNGKRLATLVPKNEPWRETGQRPGFSPIDLRQINKLYKCKKHAVKSNKA